MLMLNNICPLFPFWKVSPTKEEKYTFIGACEHKILLFIIYIYFLWIKLCLTIEMDLYVSHSLSLSLLLFFSHKVILQL